MSKKKKGNGKGRKPQPTQSNPATMSLGDALHKVGEAAARNFEARQKGQSNHLSGSAIDMNWKPYPSKPKGNLNLRTPDSQQITWTFPYENDMNSVPAQIVWTWKVSPIIEVTATLEFPIVKGANDFQKPSYIISLKNPFDAHLKEIRGVPEVAKSLATAILSAVDWENEWITHLGTDTSNPSWRDYDLAKE